MTTVVLACVILLLICVCLLLAVVMMIALKKVEWLQEERDTEMLDEKSALHAKCLAHVAQFIGDEFGAKVLEAAAEDYESVQGVADLRDISNNKYKPGGKAVPRIWLEQRASNLRERDA